jgi:hypothetical protein
MITHTVQNSPKDRGNSPKAGGILWTLLSQFPRFPQTGSILARVPLPHAHNHISFVPQTSQNVSHLRRTRKNPCQWQTTRVRPAAKCQMHGICSLHIAPRGQIHEQ